MNAILIKPTSKKMYSQILEYIKSLKAPVKILTESEEEDELFINAIEESFKSGKGSKEEMKKLFDSYGIRVL